MNNLHRELAPMSTAAWADLEAEVRATFATRAAARRVVDVPEAAGYGLSAVGTGSLAAVVSPGDGVQAQRRETYPVLELRAPFTVRRTEIDAVERGATDADWDAAKAAAAAIATAEDRAVFLGAEGIVGIAPASSNPEVALPDDVRELPVAVAGAISTLRFAGVSGPFALLLSDALYREVAETTHHGYPVRDHVTRMLGEGRIVWAPAIDGALVVSERGGDYELLLGQDLSIGYRSHDDAEVRLYLQETLTFRVNTDEASVVIARAG